MPRADSQTTITNRWIRANSDRLGDDHQPLVQQLRMLAATMEASLAAKGQISSSHSSAHQKCSAGHRSRSERRPSQPSGARLGYHCPPRRCVTQIHLTEELFLRISGSETGRAMVLFGSTEPKGRRATGVEQPVDHSVQWHELCLDEYKSFLAGTLDPRIPGPEVKFLDVKLRDIIRSAERGELVLSTDAQAAAADVTSSPCLYELRPRFEKKELPKERELRMYCAEPTSDDIVLLIGMGTKPGDARDVDGEQQAAISTCETRANDWAGDQARRRML